MGKNLWRQAGTTVTVSTILMGCSSEISGNQVDQLQNEDDSDHGWELDLLLGMFRRSNC
ncbi:hypothetical protein ABMB67_000173 [Halalkalibacter oceani]